MRVYFKKIVQLIADDRPGEARSLRERFNSRCDAVLGADREKYSVAKKATEKALLALNPQIKHVDGAMRPETLLEVRARLIDSGYFKPRRRTSSRVVKASRGRPNTAAVTSTDPATGDLLMQVPGGRTVAQSYLRGIPVQQSIAAALGVTFHRPGETNNVEQEVAASDEEEAMSVSSTSDSDTSDTHTLDSLDEFLLEDRPMAPAQPRPALQFGILIDEEE